MYTCGVYTYTSAIVYTYTPAIVPGGLVGYPHVYQKKNREFKSHVVLILLGTFSFIKRIDQQKARERDVLIETSDEKKRAVGMMTPIKIEGKYRSGRRDDTCDHGLSRKKIAEGKTYELSGKVKKITKKKKKHTHTHTHTSPTSSTAFLSYSYFLVYAYTPE